jgi:hypothetical protein
VRLKTGGKQQQLGKLRTKYNPNWVTWKKPPHFETSVSLRGSGKNRYTEHSHSPLAQFGHDDNKLVHHAVRSMKGYLALGTKENHQDSQLLYSAFKHMDYRSRGA